MISKRCVMCWKDTTPEERLHAVDFNMTGKSIPLCKECSNDLYTYQRAIAWGKAYWLNSKK